MGARSATTISLIAAVGLTAAGASAQGLEEVCSGELLVFPLPPFEAFDDDGDALIDQEEAAGCDSLATVFTELDLDATETLTRPEYLSFVAVWSQRRRSFRDSESID